MVDGGVPQDEQLHHVLVTLPAGQGQRGVVVATGRHVDLGTRVKEKLSSLKMSLSECREVEREREEGRERKRERERVRGFSATLARKLSTVLRFK